jgi:uncharacterized metal-binding protein YceD (DUF177 family)
MLSSTLIFRLNEVPEGASEREVSVPASELALGMASGDAFRVRIGFRRTHHMVEADLRVEGTLELICDRSLDPFQTAVDGRYTVLFKADTVEDVEDEQTAVRRLNISGNEVDLRRDVRDTILLSVPIRALHPRYRDADGNELPFESPASGEPATDPRWEALNVLKTTLAKN